MAISFETILPSRQTCPGSHRIIKNLASEYQSEFHHEVQTFHQPYRGHFPCLFQNFSLNLRSILYFETFVIEFILVHQLSPLQILNHSHSFHSYHQSWA